MADGFTVTYQHPKKPKSLSLLAVSFAVFTLGDILHPYLDLK